MATTLVARTLIPLLVPDHARPKWYHVVAIVALCIVLLASALGGVVDVMTGQYPLAAFALALAAGSVVGLVAVRRSMTRPATAPK